MNKEFILLFSNRMVDLRRNSGLFRPRREIGTSQSPLKRGLNQFHQSTPLKANQEREINTKLNFEQLFTESMDTDEDSEDGFQIMEVRDVEPLKDQKEQDDVQSCLTGTTRVQTTDGDFEQPLLVTISNLKKRLDQTTNTLSTYKSRNEQQILIIRSLQRKLDTASQKLHVSITKGDGNLLLMKSLKERNDELAGRLSEEKLRSAAMERNTEKLLSELTSKDISQQQVEFLVERLQSKVVALNDDFLTKLENQIMT